MFLVNDIIDVHINYPISLAKIFNRIFTNNFGRNLIIIDKDSVFSFNLIFKNC